MNQKTRNKQKYLSHIADLLGIKYNELYDDEAEFLRKARNQIVFNLITGSSISFDTLKKFDWAEEFLREETCKENGKERN